MDLIKEAFQKIKDDILLLKDQIQDLNNQIQNLKQSLNNLSTSTHSIQDSYLLQAPKQPNLAFSTGNDGVPTDKPTNQQTNQQTNNYIKKEENGSNNLNPGSIDDFEKIKQVFDSLDSIKKGIRIKFKALTPQEMTVFSTLYSLENQGINNITYKIIASNLNLSQSSIRDYINKLTSKGIPILKVKQNNKKITLRISPDLKNIAPLSTILKLREL